MLTVLLHRGLLRILFFGFMVQLTFSSPVEEGTFLATSTPYKDSIVGGYNASIEDFPYQVALFSVRNKHNRFIGGGSIISANYILTAAHCIVDAQASKTIARAGSIERENGTIIQVAELISHPNYQNLDNDVGLVKTVHPIVFTDVIKSVKLPPMHTPLEDGSIVTASGWGMTASNEPGSPVLKAVELPVVNFYECWQVHNPLLTRNMLCVAGQGGKGVCMGDSGGAAVQNGTVFGIASWATPCARPNYPDVFTDVAAPSVRGFIAKHTGL